MRFILTILLFISLGANATNYYVSNTGSDSNDGLTTSTAWQTLSKVNSSTFNAGDSILLKRGDSWNERLNIASSGNVGNHIVVGAYGSGNKPLITGFQTLTGFVNTSGNIWTVIASNAVANLNTVLVDGKIQAKGRYPNSTATNGGYLTYQSSTQRSITSSSLSGTPSYVGKECVVKVAAWILDVVKVASQSTSTLNFSSSLTYNPTSTGGTGFFFQNDSTFLDVQGEWSFDSATKRLCVYSTSLPIVQVSTIDTLIYLNHTSYITFDNLSVQGANKAAFQFDSLSNITVQNCSINYSGTIALSAQKCSYLSAINDSIQNSLSGAIYWRRVDPYTPMQDTCNYPTITGCYIHNTGIYAGMGLSNNGRYMGIYVVGHQPYIYNNQVDSTGYTPIFFNGDTSLIKNNFVSNYNFVKDDGSGIYTVVGGYIPAEYNNGSIVRKNIVINGIGNLYGVAAGWSKSPGIYLDNFTKNVTVDSNSIYNCQDAALFLNEADYNIVRYNNVYDSIGRPFYLLGSNSYISATGNNIKQNAFYSASSSYDIIYRQGGTNVGTIDDNYYSRPSNETALKLNGTIYNLSGWQSATGKDLHSQGTPSNILGTATFYYNATQSDSTITFSGTKKSLRGVSYLGSITLQPFTSAILFDAAIPRQYQYKHYR